MEDIAWKQIEEYWEEIGLFLSQRKFLPSCAQVRHTRIGQRKRSLSNLLNNRFEEAQTNQEVRRKSIIKNIE